MMIGEAVNRVAVRRGWGEASNDVGKESDKIDARLDADNTPDLNTSIVNSSPDKRESIYSDSVLQAISRSKVSSGDFRGKLRNEEVVAELPVNWQSLISTSTIDEGAKQSLSSPRKKSKLVPDAANMICRILSQYSKYCVWRIGYHHIRSRDSRKVHCPYLTGKATCKFDGCPHMARFTIKKYTSKDIVLTFSGNILHKMDSVEARRIRGQKGRG